MACHSLLNLCLVPRAPTHIPLTILHPLQLVHSFTVFDRLCCLRQEKVCVPLFSQPPPYPKADSAPDGRNGKVSARSATPQVTVCFYVAQYRVRSTPQSALHFTPRQTCSFRHHLDLFGEHSAKTIHSHFHCCLRAGAHLYAE